MADEGNVAVLEPVNIEPVEEATSETAEAALAETVVADAPEQTAESEPAASPPNLEGLTDEQVRELPQVKSLLARNEQSLRDQATAAERERLQVQANEEFERVARTVTAENIQRERNTLALAIQEAVEGGKDLKDVLPALNQSVNRLGNAATVQLVGSLEPLTTAWLQENFPEAKIAPEAVREMASYRNRGLAAGMFVVGMANAADAAYDRGVADTLKAGAGGGDGGGSEGERRRRGL